MIKKWLQKRFINLLVVRLFNAITEEDVLRLKDNYLFYKGKALSNETVEKLKLDAKSFQESNIWILLKEDAKLAANKKIYEKSLSMEDVIFGKAMLFCIDIIEQKIKNISELN